MGDPRRFNKKYKAPNTPFEKGRMLEELKFVGKYGLRNKKELWRHKYQLSGFRSRAREARSQPEHIQNQMLNDLRNSLSKLGVIGPEAHFDDVLGLNLDSILERRLQTQVFKQGLAKSIYQARQFICHRHIIVGEKVISSPSYLVKLEEQDEIKLAPNSPLQDLTLDQIENQNGERTAEEEA